MATRFNSHLFSRENYGQAPLKTGFGGKLDPDFNLQPCGLEDADTALFNLFNTELNIEVKGYNVKPKVPVVFAAGEKWAILKKGVALRDNNDSLILPIITILRSNYQQTDDAMHRGINQQTGEIVVHRRLSKEDRRYQNIINRENIKNQSNVSDTEGSSVPQLSTERTIGDLTDNAPVSQGGFISGDQQKNIIETIVVPAPQFITAQYEITIWTQYLQHMNQIIEHLISSFLPQTKGWRLETPKGYWFLATVDGDWNSESNFDDMSNSERVIKQKFTVTVRSYILASDAPGAPLPIKKYLSVPEIEFGVCTTTSTALNATVDEPFLGNDDPTLPRQTGSERKRKDNRKTGTERILVQNSDTVQNPNDPAKSSAAYKKITGVDGKTKYARINPQGESVISCKDVETIGGLLTIETIVED